MVKTNWSLGAGKLVVNVQESGELLLEREYLNITTPSCAVTVPDIVFSTGSLLHATNKTTINVAKAILHKSVLLEICFLVLSVILINKKSYANVHEKTRFSKCVE